MYIRGATKILSRTFGILHTSATRLKNPTCDQLVTPPLVIWCHLGMVVSRLREMIISKYDFSNLCHCVFGQPSRLCVILRSPLHRTRAKRCTVLQFILQMKQIRTILHKSRTIQQKTVTQIPEFSNRLFCTNFITSLLV